MEYLLWNMFGILGVVTSWMVVKARNVVHSVLYLVLVFCNMSGMLLVMEVEFIGLILVMVYVGAVAVLFLFIVMMIGGELEVEGSNSGMGMLGVWLMLGVGGMLMESGVREDSEGVGLKEVLDSESVSNMSSLGEVLFTMYLYHVLVGGFVLLVAMIGGILLGLNSE